MRHGSNRRNRNRNGSSRGNSGASKSKVFDSNGPDVRIRGTAFQVTEKYLALAKDAAAAGNRVLEESYLQHAEHYQRVISSWQTEMNKTSDNHSNHSKSSAKKSGNQGEQKPNNSDDLSLPSSILAAAPKVEIKEDAAENA